jgi:hypothetical protein
MIRKIKTLGIVLAAALALSAMVASGAQGMYHVSAPHSILVGSQTGSHVFTFGEGFGNITCTTSEIVGTTTAQTPESLTVTGTTSGCKDSVAGRTVHVAPYTYTFTTPKTTTGEAEVHTIKATTTHITAGGFGTCHVEIPVQTVGGITYHNLGGTNGVELTTESTGIDTVTSGGFFNCGLANGAHTGGQYVGTTNLKAFTTEGSASAISVTP